MEELQIERIPGENDDDHPVSVRGLYHTYNGKDYVINDVSFQVRRGEIFGLLGKNGAGKTSTIKILTTLMPATRGEAKVLGHDVRTQGKEIRKRIGFVQQEVSFEYSTVKQNLDIYGFLWGVPKETREKRREDLIKTFGLERLAKSSAWDLSGGEKRRLQVAREFMHDMDLLFLDEPTVGLDPIMRRKILDLVRGKARNEGLAVIFTTHNLEEADYICDRVAIMDRGRFQALDTVDSLKRKFGENKSIEILLANPDGSTPSYDRFFERLMQAHPDIEITRQPVGTEPAVIVSKKPEGVLESIIRTTTEERLKLEWLNVRKSTLEDIFIETVSSGGDQKEATTL